MKLSELKYPVAAFFEPARNLKMLAEMGVNVVLGPEVEDSKNLPPATLIARQSEWLKIAYDLGLAVALKNPQTLPEIPPNCVAFVMTVDEPNGKGILPAALTAEVSRLRGIDARMPIILSLAGDKITSANFSKPAELQLYKDYADLADVLTVDAYSMNRNASRYPLDWTAQAVAKLAKVATSQSQVVWAWLEMNDQQLPPPTSKTDGKNADVNRAPTPAEIKAQADACLAAGAKGIGWFATCDSGKYGWGIKDPAKGDSYWPLIDRAGKSMSDQILMVRQISLALTGGVVKPPVPPPPPQPTIEQRVAVLELWKRGVNQDVDAAIVAATNVQKNLDVHAAAVNDTLSAHSNRLGDDVQSLAAVGFRLAKLETAREAPMGIQHLQHLGQLLIDTADRAARPAITVPDRVFYAFTGQRAAGIAAMPNAKHVNWLQLGVYNNWPERLGPDAANPYDIPLGNARVIGRTCAQGGTAYLVRWWDDFAPDLDKPVPIVKGALIMVDFESFYTTPDGKPISAERWAKLRDLIRAIRAEAPGVPVALYGTSAIDGPGSWQEVRDRPEESVRKTVDGYAPFKILTDEVDYVVADFCVLSQATPVDESLATYAVIAGAVRQATGRKVLGLVDPHYRTEQTILLPPAVAKENMKQALAANDGVMYWGGKDDYDLTFGAG